MDILKQFEGKINGLWKLLTALLLMAIFSGFTVFGYFYITSFRKRSCSKTLILSLYSRQISCVTTLKPISGDRDAHLTSVIYFLSVFRLKLCFFIKSICLIVLSLRNNWISSFSASVILSSLPIGLPLFSSRRFL